MVATVRITEAELARDLHAVLAKVRAGSEVIVEQEDRPVAVIRRPAGPGRSIGECIELARAHEQRLGYAPAPDAEFGRDVERGIEDRAAPFDPPKWD